MIESEVVTAQTIDLTNYNKEPIHIPGCIQPNGVLFALQEPELTILQVSNNTLDYLGIHSHELLGENLNKLFNTNNLNYLKKSLLNDDIAEVNPLELTIEVNKKILKVDGIIHRIDSVLILELEPLISEKSEPLFSFYRLVKPLVSKLQGAANITKLCKNAVKEMRKLTGFDRVMVYQFDNQWNGSVIAEDKAESLESFLGLHFPVFDIPTQARKMYCLNWLRLITNVDYQPVGIIPTCNPLTNKPLDLSKAILRSVSWEHVTFAR